MTPTTNSRRRVRIEELRGLWKRALYVAPDGTRDATTNVDWLQAQSFYADLRQPLPSSAFESVRSLRDLTWSHVEELAAQEGFAGVLLQDGDAFEWTRYVDFRPRSGVPDRGRLENRGGVLIEYGLEADYVEHWHRAVQEDAPSAALSIRDRASHVEGICVRVGPTFMLARSRAIALGSDSTLAEMVRDAPTLTIAQDLVDCELSLGCVTRTWAITRSSLPYRIGADLEPLLDGDTFTTSDVHPDGTRFRRTWDVIEQEGDVAVGFELVRG